MGGGGSVMLDVLTFIAGWAFFAGLAYVLAGWASGR
jgi:hypothetical protein